MRIVVPLVHNNVFTVVDRKQPHTAVTMEVRWSVLWEKMKCPKKPANFTVNPVKKQCIILVPKDFVM